MVALYVFDLNRAGWKHPSPELIESMDAQPQNENIPPRSAGTDTRQAVEGNAQWALVDFADKDS